MLKLKEMKDFENANYYGFTLKKGFFYGVEESTNTPVAASGWYNNDAVAVYFLENGKWELAWIDPEDIIVEGVEKVSPASDKMPFKEWLEDVQGIDWVDYDNNFSGSAATQIENEYEDYLYNNAPLFLRN